MNRRCLFVAKVHDVPLSITSIRQDRANGDFVRDAAYFGDDGLAGFKICHRQSITPASRTLPHFSDNATSQDLKRVIASAL